MASGRSARLALVGAVVAVFAATALVPAGTAYGQAFTEPSSQISTHSVAAVAAASRYPCIGYSGLQYLNPLSAVKADVFAWSTFKPYKVGNGTGNINWRLNPYKNVSWYQWLNSLRWVGTAIIAGTAGDAAALDHVRAIAKDWIRDNPYPWTADVGANGSTMHRINALICLRQAILARSGGVLPAADAWLDTALLSHARFIQNYWVGAGSNTGTDQSLALLGVGCLLDRTDLRDLAVARLTSGISLAIDSQGASNEQASAYAQFNYSLWGRAEQALVDCDVSALNTIALRRQLLAGFIAQSTNPLGRLAQLGDSEVVSAVPFPGTDAEWAGSGGKLGKAPTVRVSKYAAGYAFGRSGWGNGSRAFRQESFYSLRYGPARALHGHYDHTSLTYVARGRDILIDAGHPGYVAGPWRTWSLSPQAHSEMTVPTARLLPLAVTKLSGSVIQAGGEFFEVADHPYVGVSRIRAVLALHDPDVLVVLDRGYSTKTQQWQTLWHLPSDQIAAVHSRTTAIATKAGDTTQTILFQVPFRQALPRGAILTLRGQTTPTIQGWHYPNITVRHAASTLMFARSATTATILSVIAPTRAGAGVGYTLTAAAGGVSNLNLNVAGVRVRVRISPGNALSRG